jgi:hypothetical protein
MLVVNLYKESYKLVEMKLPPIPRPQRLIPALPLWPHRLALRANSFKPTPHLPNLTFGLLTERAPSRLGDTSPVFVLPILIAGWHDDASALAGIASIKAAILFGWARLDEQQNRPL